MCIPIVLGWLRPQMTAGQDLIGAYRCWKLVVLGRAFMSVSKTFRRPTIRRRPIRRLAIRRRDNLSTPQFVDAFFALILALA